MHDLDLTDEEIEELNRLFHAQSLKQQHYRSGYGGDFGLYDGDYDFEVPEVIETCKHDWRKDMFFSAKVYETCKKCGKKKEDV